MPKKRCSICKKPKLTKLFSKNKRRRDGLQTHCKECNKKHSSKYYKKNRIYHRKRVILQKQALRQRNSLFLWKYLSTHPCIDCGNTNPVVLEFDHVRGEKIAPVSKLARDAWSLDSLKEEIAKCDVRCANCHRLKTAKDFKWYGSIAQLVELKTFNL